MAKNNEILMEKKKCEKCNGTGCVTCWKCEGVGSSEHKTCSRCHCSAYNYNPCGDGKTRCGTCNGSGEIVKAKEA